MGNMKRQIKRLVVFPAIIITLQVLYLMKRAVEVVMSFVRPARHPAVVRTPEDCFKGLEAVGYSFRPNYVELPIGGGKMLPRVHYIDEGEIVSVLYIYMVGMKIAMLYKLP